MSITTPARPSHASNTYSITNLVEAVTNAGADGGGGNGAPATYPGGGAGSNGSNGSVSIWQYGKN